MNVKHLPPSLLHSELSVNYFYSLYLVVILQLKNGSNGINTWAICMTLLCEVETFSMATVFALIKYTVCFSVISLTKYQLL